MGGVDKGLQLYRRRPLIQHVIERIAGQVSGILISANRNHDAYVALGGPFGARVIQDSIPVFPGPLAGLLCGLREATTEYVMCVPCDVPGLPSNLASELARGLASVTADIAFAVSVDSRGVMVSHPVLSLVRATLACELERYLVGGQRKVSLWYQEVKAVPVLIEDERALFNANTTEDLYALELEHRVGECLKA